MKLDRNIIFFLIAILWAGIFVGCSEDDTLDGANEVYITLNPMDITLRVGDTVKISAVVTNLSGNRIETPVSWSVLDESVATVLGDTAIVCVKGAQGKETKLKAKLVNGKYGLASVIVTTNLPKGIVPVNANGVEITSKSSYNTAHDSISFAVTPKELLEDFVPQYTIEDLEPFSTPMTIDKEKGLVTIHYSAPQAGGQGKVTVTIGEQASMQSASCTVILSPIILATFYGEKYAEMDYIRTRPNKSVMSMYFAYTNETNVDINSEATIRVAMNTPSGALADIEASYSAYRWEVISGSAVIVTEMREELFEGEGFDAVLTVRSGLDEGEAEFHCITPDTVLVATFNVQNFKTRYPVDEITVDRSSISMPMGGSIILTTGVVPTTSYAYHKPVVVAADPSLVEIGEYDGNMITLRGLEMGETTLLLTANGKELEVPVTVTEGIRNVTWESGNNLTLFAGQSVQWGVNVATTSGDPNVYDVIWTSSDTSILTAAPVEGDKAAGTITAIAEGEASVSAQVVNVKSDPAKVKVLGLPEGLMYTSANTDYENCYVSPEMDDELSVVIAPTTGYGLIMITLDGAYTGGSSYDGTYQVDAYPVSVSIDGAVARATSGTVTIATDNEGNILISCDLTVTVGSSTFTLKADNVLGT